MLRRNWPFILAAFIVFSLFGYFYYLYHKSPTLDWRPTYDHNSDSPYGTELLYRVMKVLYSQKDFNTVEEPLIYNREFNKDDDKNSIYFFCGNEFSPDRSTVSALSKFIERGNQVFIAAGSISSFFIDSLLHPAMEDQNKKAFATSHIECLSYQPGFIHPELKNSKKFSVKFKIFTTAVPMSAGYLSQGFIDEDLGDHDFYRIGIYKVARQDSLINYIKIKVGKGWLHLYTTPLELTNYYLRKKEVFDHSQNIFLHMEPGNVYWHVNTFANMDIQNVQMPEDKNPFGVLLSFDSFRYAWYSFCAAILIFCLFGSKRKQRPVPVLEKNTNTSIEFAETISKLYLADGRHKNIAMQKYRYFFNFIKTKYGINLKENNEDEKRRLAVISKMPLKNIDQIMFNYIKMETLPDTTAEELFESVGLINSFYENVS